MSKLKTGTVKWFSKTKGYGFIKQDSGPDIFAHFSSIVSDGFQTLIKGDKVEYIVKNGEKGPQADKIIKIKSNGKDKSSANPKSHTSGLRSFLNKLCSIFR